jgi:hypothetical protein
MNDDNEEWEFFVHELTEEEANAPFELECERCDLKVTDKEIQVFTRSLCGVPDCPSCNEDTGKHLELLCPRCYADVTGRGLH